MATTQPMAVPTATTGGGGAQRRLLHNAAWYILLCLIGVVTILPFLWILFTSFKGPTDTIVSMPPQLFPHDPTVANYLRVWNQLPMGRFFLNSLTVSVCTVLMNVVVCALAAYPLAKMRFRGREVIFYLLLATMIVPRAAYLYPELCPGRERLSLL